MTRPALMVEVAFGVDSNDATAVAAMTSDDWTDIAEKVQAAPTIERSKRSTELDKFEAGTVKLTLDNSDGRFSPTNASSPYWPDVKPYRMIRIRAVLDTPGYEEASYTFETDLGGWAVNLPDSGTGAVAFGAAAPHTGAGSFEWQAGTGSFGAYPGVRRDFYPTIPGITYTITAWAYQLSLVGSGLYLGAYSGSLGVVYTPGVLMTTVGAWTQMSFTFTAADTQTDLLCMASGTPAAGASFFVDDITVASTSYPMWQGYVERWPTRWLDPARGLCEIECVDAMATAAQIDMSGIYTLEVLADAPLYYYPLTDDSGAAQASNQSTTQQQPAVPFHDSLPLGSSDSWGFGGQLPIAGADSQQGLTLATTDGGSGNVSGYGLRLPFIPWTWDHWTWEFWFAASAGATGDMLEIFDAGLSRNYALSVALDAGGRIAIIVTTPQGYTTGSQETSTGFANDNAHHIVVTWSSPTPKLYVDGVLWTLPTLTGSTFTGSRTHLVQLGSQDTIGAGIPNKNSDAGASGAFSGVLGQVAFYPQTLSASRISAHYAAGTAPLGEQLLGYRAASLLGYAKFPLWHADFGATWIQPATNVAGKSLLDTLQDLADTENSELYADNGGLLTLTGRRRRMSQAAPAATFGSDVAGGEIPYQLEGLQLDYDPNLVFNDVTVDRQNGSSPRVYDAASILAYFDRGLSRTSWAASDTDAQASAAWLLDRYREPQIRSEAITIAAGSLGPDVIDLWPKLLALYIGSRVLINHRPLNQPAIAIPGFVDQITHAIDPDAGTWNVTLQISPLFHEYFALADPVDHTWDVQSTPDAGGFIYLSY